MSGSVSSDVAVQQAIYRSPRFWTGVALIILIIGFVAAELVFASVGPGQALAKGQLTDAQAKAINVMLKLCDSFITWAVATVGGVAVLIMFNIEKRLPYTRGDAILASASIICAVVSIFCGHLAIDLTGRALAVDQFPVTVMSVHYFLMFQYIFALLGVALLGGFSINFFFAHAGAPSSGGTVE